MTDDQFILILKAKLKEFYIENRSVGLEVRSLVALFRQEIEDDLLTEIHKTKKKRLFKKPLNPTKWPH